METHRKPPWYLPRPITGAAVMLLGASGIVALTVWIPGVTDVALAAFVPGPPAGRTGPMAQKSPERAEEGARVRVKCPECGFVESTREIEQSGEGAEPGAAGEVTRGDRNEITGSSTRTYEVTLRMNDGSRHVFMDAKQASWRPGARVIIIQGESQSGN